MNTVPSRPLVPVSRICFTVFPTLMALLGFVALLGCQPNDYPTRNTKQKLEAGEVVEFRKPGYRRPSCSARQPDWKDLRVKADERERIVLGKQLSQVSPGKHSCLRVGSVVNLQVIDGAAPTKSGLVRVQKLALVKIGQLRSQHLQGRYFASNFGSYVSEIRARLKPEDDDIVLIAEFVYLSGTAADEAVLKQKDLERGAQAEFEQTEKDGDSLSSDCRQPWKDVVIAAAFSERVLSGKIKSWYTLGARNCLSHGQIAGLKTGLKDPELARVKITRIKRFAVRALTPTYLSAPDAQDYAAIVEQLTKDNAQKQEDVMTVVDFELEKTP